MVLEADGAEAPRNTLTLLARLYISPILITSLDLSAKLV
jgi:hypothetical protein